MLELCNNFTGLKWGIEFWLRSKTKLGIGNHRFLSEIRVQDSMFGAQNPSINLGRATTDLHNERDFGFGKCRST